MQTEHEPANPCGVHAESAFCILNSALRALAVVCLVGAAVIGLAAQQPPSSASFEVATVKVNNSGGGRGSHAVVPQSGQVTVTNITVAALIQEAYDLQLPSLIVDMPEWARTQRVDVVARAGAPAPVPVLQRMLQPVLAEHFKLAVRRETRDMDALVLVAAVNGRPGPKLKKSDVACDGTVGSVGFSRAADAADKSGPCGVLPGGAGRIVARGIDMAGFAELMSTNPRRPVIDRTGFIGRFDIDFTYTPEAFSAAAVAQRPGGTVPPGVDPNGPPLATALLEQLGLKLEPIKAPVEVLVITRLEPLSP
jgi:uncharacterized protein (TIGR03435 family)